MSLLGMFGQILLTSTIILSLLQFGKYRPLFRWMALVISAIVGLLEIDDIPLIAYPGGVLGDLSITTQILLTSVVAKQIWRVEVFSPRERSTILLAAAGAGLVLYPLSSGLTMIDVYSLGFDSTALMLGLSVLAVIGWYVRPGAAMLIPLGVIAFNFSLLASNNVWDYLLDPMLTLLAWGWLIYISISRALASARPTADSNP